MNILIVDDNQDNRSVLRIFLELYFSTNESLVIEEVENGLEAVQHCQHKTYDMVFMDIEMPVMDGIKATDIIRKLNNKTVIIAVSADDEEGKRAILDKGAEDYIQKPIDYEIFTSRLNSYTALLEHRGMEKINTVKKNLFTSQVYRRHTRFIIDSEDGLSEFWEFFLLNARAKYHNLSDVVRTVFSIAETQLKLSIKCSVYLEENETVQYFTMINIGDLPQNMLKLLLAKNKPICAYKIDNDKISFELPKKISSVAEDQFIQQQSKPMTIEPVSILKSTQELRIFDYILPEDLIDVEEYASKLSSLMLIVGGGDIHADEVVEMNAYLENIASILSSYSEVYPISIALRNLSVEISTHIDEFIKNSEALGPMCKAFSNDMTKWIEMSFHSGAPSVDFMNDTIKVNCETIVNMLHINDTTIQDDDDLNDIFDF